MKVLLIKPPVRDFYQTSIRTQPTGLAYIATSLVSHGHEVEILDCQTEKKKSEPLPPEFSYLSEFYYVNDRSPFKLFSNFYHFGMSWGEIRQKIEESNADVFGISSLFTPYHGEALEIAKIIKNCRRENIVVMGGSHVSCDPEGVLNNPCVDYIVIGEGEIRFPLLLEKIKNNKKNKIKDIDGIGYKENGKSCINPARTLIMDVDSLPYPAIHLLDPELYWKKKERSAVVITSRGCPHKCAYCSAHLTMGSLFRARSPKAVVKEMIYYSDEYGIRIFDFEDDNFTFDKERAKHLLSLIITNFGERNLHLSAMNGVSFASLDRELLVLMKKVGFDTVNLSFVSTDERTKERMNRPEAVIGFDQSIEDANSEGLQVIAYGIIGMPGQTIEEMTDTMIYLMGRKVLIGPSVYYPTPGTPLFLKCREDGLLPEHQSLWRSSAIPIETDEFSRLDLVTLLRLVRIINFVKEKSGREFEDGMSWRNILQWLKENTPEAKNWDILDRANIWKELLFRFLEEKSLFALTKTKTNKPGMEIVKINASERVIDYFFNTAWDRPVKRYKLQDNI
jgi:radical SAM superfamily enzyme YgiQ (UPF0313 family)